MAPGARLETYVALLRGINLGSHKRVAMGDLRQVVVALGGEDVQTYVQSGNVVLRSKQSASELVSAIEKSIRQTLGLDVTVIVRSQARLAKIIQGNPFVGQAADPTKLHLTLLGAKPDAADVSGLSEKYSGGDAFEVVGEDVYLHCPGGYGRTKLNNAFFEKHLRVTATTRNWRTMTALAELANA
jgi:uncharacterized protein (DUF1697 family)